MEQHSGQYELPRPQFIKLNYAGAESVHYVFFPNLIYYKDKLNIFVFN